MTQFRPTGFNILPPVVKNILIINALFFLATITFDSVFRVDLVRYLGLHYPAASHFNPYQFVTYMFMHGGFAHLFFNMFALWMFGNALENVWGAKRFLIYYFVTGIGAGIIYLIWISVQIVPTVGSIDSFIQTRDLDILNTFLGEHRFRVGQSELISFNNILTRLNVDPENREALQAAVNFMTNYKQTYLNQFVVIGASGSVFGILLAFGMMFPNSLLYIYFAFPIKAKYFVIAYGALELISGIMDNPADNVAHFAHLGGMLFGFLLIKYWKKKGIFY
ncbi:MAG: rhomboid family intramembrane serine protease [Lentimicrobiaceae bacterium]|jgi:membrane associated rhomboid family serine protease|nr:rhomboid family intramembrane serine protease [Lentimicrobiaceae bacterium]